MKIFLLVLVVLLMTFVSVATDKAFGISTKDNCNGIGWLVHLVLLMARGGVISIAALYGTRK